MKINMTMVILVATIFAPHSPAASLKDHCSKLLEGPVSSLVSLLGTVEKGELQDGLLPRGSAVITSSGALGDKGITAIIHAASGAMTRQGGVYEPTLESIRNSVRNAVRLAELNNHGRIAIPLVGGGIFLQRLGVDRQELAVQIISAAVEQRQSNLELHFVGIGEMDVNAFRAGLEIVHSPDGAHDIYVDQGSITDFAVHGATAIVNAANTEVIFGGGISGAIGRETRSESEINAEAQSIIQRLSHQVNGP